MPPAITAALYGDQVPPLVVVTVTGVTGATDVDIWREPPALPAVPVRGGTDLVPTGDAIVLLDPDPELGRPLVYVVQAKIAGVVTQTSSAPVTVPDPGRHVLSDPYTGEAVLVDLIATPDERRQDVPHSRLRPKGRRRPIPLYDVRSDDSGELVVYTRSAQETDRLEELTSLGGPLVSRHPFDGCDVEAREVLFLPATSRARRSRSGDRLWTMPFDVVDTPDPATPTPTPTLLDLANYVPTTLQAIANTWATLAQIAQDDLAA